MDWELKELMLHGAISPGQPFVDSVGNVANMQLHVYNLLGGFLSCAAGPTAEGRT